MIILSSIFKWIVSTTVMATFLIVILLCLKMLFKHRFSPKWHYFLWLILLLRLVLPWTPRSIISVFNITRFSRDALGLFSAVILNLFSSTKSTTGVNPAAEAPAYLNQEHIVSLHHPFHPHETMFGIFPLHWMSVLALLWSAGTLFFGIRMARGYIGMRQRYRGGLTVTDSRIRSIMVDCQRIYEIKRNVPVLCNDGISSPTLFGIFRPRIYISDKVLRRLNDNDMRYVFMHELAHYKQKDIAVNYVMMLVLIVHWFNPFIWYAYSRMRSDQEMACDARVLTCLQSDETKEYGFTMIKLLEVLSGSSGLIQLPNFIDEKQNIKERIHRISRFGTDKKKWTIFSSLILLLVSCTFLTNAESMAAQVKGSGGNSANISKPTSVFSTGAGSNSAAGQNAENAPIPGVKSLPGGAASQAESVSHSDHDTALSTMDSSSVSTQHQQFIRTILNNASKGRIQEFPFTIGQSTITDVLQQWGKPSGNSKVGKGQYASFGNHSAAVGYNGKDRRLFDIRTFLPKYQKLRQNDIIGTLGQPDAITTYQDQTHNQRILIYHIHSMVELQFVFPKATKKEPNPRLNHMNLFNPSAVHK